MNRAKSGRKKQLHQKVGCKTRAFVDDSIVHWQAAMLALQRWNNIGPHLTWLAETRLLLRLPSWNKRFILRRAALKALADRIGMSFDPKPASFSLINEGELPLFNRGHG